MNETDVLERVPANPCLGLPQAERGVCTVPLIGSSEASSPGVGAVRAPQRRGKPAAGGPRRDRRCYINLHVFPISADVDDRALLEVFRGHGAVRAKVARDEQTGRSKGFGFLLFDTEEKGRAVYEAIAAARAAWGGTGPATFPMVVCGGVVLDVLPAHQRKLTISLKHKAFRAAVSGVEMAVGGAARLPRPPAPGPKEAPCGAVVRVGPPPAYACAQRSSSASLSLSPALSCVSTATTFDANSDADGEGEDEGAAVWEPCRNHDAIRTGVSADDGQSYYHHDPYRGGRIYVRTQYE